MVNLLRTSLFSLITHCQIGLQLINSHRFNIVFLDDIFNILSCVDITIYGTGKEILVIEINIYLLIIYISLT